MGMSPRWVRGVIVLVLEERWSLRAARDCFAALAMTGLEKCLDSFGLRYGVANVVGRR